MRHSIHTLSICANSKVSAACSCAPWQHLTFFALLHLPPPQPERRTPDGLVLLADPEMGRENPAELKAQKLARSMTRGVADKWVQHDGCACHGRLNCAF